MVADVIEHLGDLLPTLPPTDDHADRGLAGIVLGQRRGRRQQVAQEFHRHDVHALVLDRLERNQPDRFEHFEVLDVGVAKRHPEADLLQALDVLHQAFLFLMIDEVGFARADFRIVHHRLDRERRDLDPLALFPVFAVLRHFAEVDLRVEVRRKRLAMVAGIAVDDVDIVDLVEQVFLRIGAPDVRDARIKPAAEDGGQAGRLEPLLIGPLPGIFELRDFPRLIVRGVEIVHARLEAGVHDRQVLIGQGHVDHEVRLHLLDEGHGRGHVIGVHLRNLDRRDAILRHLLAALDPPRGQRDVLECLAVHRAFLGDDRACGAGADDENIVHEAGDPSETGGEARLKGAI